MSYEVSRGFYKNGDEMKKEAKRYQDAFWEYAGFYVSKFFDLSEQEAGSKKEGFVGLGMPMFFTFFSAIFQRIHNGISEENREDVELKQMIMEGFEHGAKDALEAYGELINEYCEKYGLERGALIKKARK